MIKSPQYEIDRLTYFYKLLNNNEVTTDRLSRFTDGCIDCELNNRNLDRLRIEHEYLKDAIKLLEAEQ